MRLKWDAESKSEWKRQSEGRRSGESSDRRESKGWSSTRENCYNVPQYGVVSCELAPRQWKFSGLRERHRPKCILSGPWSVLYRWLPIRHFHSPKSSCSRFFSSSTSFCYGFERNVGSRTTISYVLKQRNYSERIFSLRVMTILRKLKRMLWHWCYVKADAVRRYVSLLESLCFDLWHLCLDSEDFGCHYIERNHICQLLNILWDWRNQLITELLNIVQMIIHITKTNFVGSTIE